MMHTLSLGLAMCGRQRAAETLVLAGVVVLEVDLEVDGLEELAGVRLGLRGDVLDGLLQLRRGNLRHGCLFSFH